MSNIVFGAIMPHGDYIPELGGPNPPKMAQTHAAALEIESLLEESRPDTIIIATPHGIAVDRSICVGMTSRSSGMLKGVAFNISVLIDTDIPFAQQLSDSASQIGIRIAEYVGDTAQGVELPLDWGVMMPLWYCGLRKNAVNKYKFVIVCPANNMLHDQYLAFGKCISDIAQQTGKRVAIIASCDWAHAHSKDGPYGFHPAAKQFDTQVQQIIASGDLNQLVNISPDIDENALSDGTPQALILQGAIDTSNLSAYLLSYQCPTYFGMMVASFS